MSSRASSSFPTTPSMVSVITTTSGSSTTPLRHALPSQPQKDYSAAFGALQTQYGWGPVTSVPVESARVKEAQEKKAAKEKTEAEKARRKVAKASAPIVGQTGKPQRDYESAFGALSSKIGFGGSRTPSVGQRK